MNIKDISFEEMEEAARGDSPEILAELAKSADWRIVVMVARNPATSSETLHHIYCEWYFRRSVCWALEANPSLPDYIRQKLAFH